MRRGHGAAGAGERLTPAHVAIPERPDAHATDASADEHEEGQAEDVGARAIIEALLHLRVVLRLAARRAHEAKRGAVSTIPSAGFRVRGIKTQRKRLNPTTCTDDSKFLIR